MRARSLLCLLLPLLPLTGAGSCLGAESFEELADALNNADPEFYLALAAANRHPGAPPPEIERFEALVKADIQSNQAAKTFKLLKSLPVETHAWQTAASTFGSFSQAGPIDPYLLTKEFSLEAFEAFMRPGKHWLSYKLRFRHWRAPYGFLRNLSYAWPVNPEYLDQAAFERSKRYNSSADTNDSLREFMRRQLIFDRRIQDDPAAWLAEKKRLLALGDLTAFDAVKTVPVESENKPSAPAAEAPPESIFGKIDPRILWGSIAALGIGAVVLLRKIVRRSK